MLIRAGYNIAVRCETATPIAALQRPSLARRSGHSPPAADRPQFAGAAPKAFPDQFGNVCTRTVVPAGTLTLSTDFIIEDSALGRGGRQRAPRSRWTSSRTTPSNISLEPVLARPTSSRTSPGHSSARPPRGLGAACRRLSTSFTTTSRSGTSTRRRPARRGTRIATGSACAATSRTCRSRSAGP